MFLDVFGCKIFSRGVICIYYRFHRKNLNKLHHYISNFADIQSGDQTDLISDEATHFVGPHLDQNCLQKSSILIKSSLLTFRDLTHSPLLTTIVPYTNSFDPDETPNISASQQDPSCLTLRQHFHQLLVTLRHFEN